MDLEVIEAPEDWTGPLQEIPREQSEAWENSRSEEDATEAEEAQPTEEIWEAETIKTGDVASGANERNR